MIVLDWESIISVFKVISTDALHNTEKANIKKLKTNVTTSSEIKTQIRMEIVW